MKTKKNIMKNYIFWFFLIPLFIFCITDTGFAASTTTLLRQIGSGAQTASGDYIGSNQGAGLDAYYRYFIEVPPGTARLTVEIYDADIGAVANYTDWQIGTGYNTSCNYYLNNPAGGNVADVTYNNTQAAADSTWTQIYTVAAPADGHWELRVQMNSAITAGDDVNGYGIRAHDGTAGAGGTEYNVYADSFIPLGVIGLNPTTMTTTFYPYVTSGCTVDWNDFDGDNGTNFSVFSYLSRTGSVTGSYAGAANDVWLNRPITNFETDVVNNTDMDNSETGLWTATGTYTTLGGSTANFGVFYAGNSSAANPPPTAQPQANSFRVYLPNDSGGKPAKPFLLQKVSHVSGPNPPSNGNTTRARIEVIFSNPTPFAVRINATSRRVIANVPGGGVVYAGNASISQGSIASQPAIGGTGDVIGNPGIVAANTDVTMRYEVNVTPTSAGQRLDVTGTAANGTRTTYRDETNVIAARAQYLYGPLCGLAVTEGGNPPIPTWVAVSCFEACAEESQPTVEWHTASEIGTVGFNLWRQDRDSREFQLVNPQFLPSLPNAPEGGVYRLADPGAPFGEPVVYRLEEVDSLGRTMSYGPFTITFGAAALSLETENPSEKTGKEMPSDIYGFQRFHRERSAYELERLQARQLTRQAGAATAASQGKERARITVKGRGLFYVSAAQIASSMGISVAQAKLYIAQQKLNMTSMGKDIAWLADAGGAGAFFYNEGTSTTFTDQSVFWLEQGSGLAMESIGAGSSSPAASGQSYKETLHFEENRYALMVAGSNPLGDIWYWDYVAGGSAGKSFPVHVPGVTASGSAALTVTLQGATDTAASNDHHAVVALNGKEIGGAWWNGTKAHTFKISFNSSMLKEGANTISVSGLLDMGAAYSVFYVESFDLSYQRQYKADNNTLLCRSDGHPVVSVSGFTQPQVIILDISKPERPKQVTGASPDVSGRITFVPRDASNANSRYLVIALNAALRPLSVKGDMPARLNTPAYSAEYVVIAPEEFKASAQKLADYRKSKGLTTLVATLEDIYESFNYGLASPLAVRDFLAYAYSKWGGKKVKYAVLMGKGTYDYKDYLGLGDNLLPVILAKTPEGLCAADKAFGDVKGNDGIPEIAIGRLPAVTNNELQIMIDKIKAYDSGTGPWTDKMLMIADNTDDGGDFAAGSDELASLATGYQVERIYLNNAAQAAEIRARVIARFNSGAALVNYCGHAGLDQLAKEKIFRTADVPSLKNGSQLPVMVMLTCVSGRFEIPGVVCLSEALLLKENGGISAGLVPSGAALFSQSKRLGEEFYKAIFRGKAATAGEAWLAAMKNFLQLGGKPYMLNIYNWLGDPALLCK